ncbi:TetR/AcrR family transcriptional regulator [Streptomyces sp. NPDC050548]|uniref:TetR/AcrR family transcriptional regulator n=1 Tax=Streptomyces sp. NPDC050548 TaxID=3365629 RepID=UPI00379C533A
MQPRSQQHGRPGRPARLSRDAILSRADRILKEEGPERLSMRRLAKEMTITPMALYYHVKDKDELLMLLLNAYSERMAWPELPRQPRERLVMGAWMLRDLLAECPWAVQALSADLLESASALRIVENMIDAAVACGLSHDEALFAYRVIWYYIVGELLIRLNRERARLQDGQRPSWEGALLALDPILFPLLARLRDQWATPGVEDDQRRRLEVVVDGLLARGPD